MPVHFKCGFCGGLLKVGSRKIGQSVDCPKCQAKVVVPATDVLSGAEVPAKPARKSSEKAVAANRSGAAEPAGEPWTDDEDSETGDVRRPEFVVYDHPADDAPQAEEPPGPAAVPSPAAPAAKNAAPQSIAPTAAGAPALSVSQASFASSLSAPAPVGAPAAVSVASAAGPGGPTAASASASASPTLSVASAAASAPVVLPTPLIGFPALPTAMADPAAVNPAPPNPAPPNPAAATNSLPTAPAPKLNEPAAATAPSPEAAPKPKSPTGSPSPAAAPQPSSRFVPPSHMILLSRAFFGTIVLSLLLLAVFTFLLGLVVGGRYAPAAPPAPPPAPISKQVLVEGRLVYQPFPGRKVGDAGSVVFVLPATAGAGDLISAEALAPGASDEVFREAEAALRGRGGGAAVCDGDGRFLVNLPAQGTYRMLCVSKKVKLPAPPPAEAIAALEPFFRGAAGRLAGRAVKWSPLQADSEHVSVKPADFGLEER